MRDHLAGMTLGPVVRFLDATTGESARFTLDQDPDGKLYMATDRACDVVVLEDARRAGRVVQRVLPGGTPQPFMVHDIAITITVDGEARVSVSLDAVRPVTRDPAVAIAGTQGSFAGGRVPSGPGGVSGAR